MRNLYSALPKFVPVIVLFSLISPRISAQTSNAQPRIAAAAVNDAQTTVLRGNTHPLARPQFDRGPAPATLPMEHMLMVLHRSPAQEAALESFMAEQLDRSSPNYHHWLTPAEFGEMYGPAQQDIDTITKWLGSHGFQVEKVGAGRTVIQFSGNAAQVQTAFHTTIHQYAVKDGQHWANSSDPAIPTALAPVVAGIRSLHNFYPKPASHVHRMPAASARPFYTFNSGAQSCDIAGAAANCYTVGPNDFATIYNVQQLWNNNITGAGQTIAIMADSNINTADVTQFRALFGLPATTPTNPNVIVNGANPGKTSDEIEAVLDTEWAGAVAKGAQIDLVVSKSTNAAFGGDLSAEYAIDFPNATHTNSSTGLAPILSYSFGDCELQLGSGPSGGNAFYNTEWQQAAAEGITVLVSTGDNGSAGCDIDEINGPITQAASNGLQVNGLASTPYDIGVGGTDFNDLGFETTGGPNSVGYWNPAPGTVSSALSYIPETAWNDTCTNPEVILLAGVANAVASCSNLTVQENFLVEVTGGSGGVSGCISTNSNNGLPSSCTGGYPKPCFQLAATTGSCNSSQIGGVTTPNDNARDLPDVSLFAGDGFAGSFYVMCEMDTAATAGEPGTGQNNQACALGAAPVFVGVGGTSVSVQAFAGIMALVDQVHGAQGAANLTLYKLFASQNDANCISNPPGMGSAPAPGCIFNDVTVGAGGAVATNAMPCVPNSTNCSTTASVPNSPSGRTPQINVRAVRTICALGIGLLLLFGLRRKQRRWVTSAAMCGAVLLLVVSVGCGGGNGGQEGGGGGAGTPEGVMTGYNTAVGFDLATGLGSVNALNFVNANLWAAAPPMEPPAAIKRPTVTAPAALLAIACALCLAFLFAGLRRKQIRWSTAVLLLAFALSILNATRSSAATRAGSSTPQHRVASSSAMLIRH
jgi:hypothetical protein